MKLPLIAELTYSLTTDPEYPCGAKLTVYSDQPNTFILDIEFFDETLGAYWGNYCGDKKQIGGARQRSYDAKGETWEEARGYVMAYFCKEIGRLQEAVSKLEAAKSSMPEPCSFELDTSIDYPRSVFTYLYRSVTI